MSFQPDAAFAGAFAGDLHALVRHCFYKASGTDGHWPVKTHGGWIVCLICRYCGGKHTTAEGRRSGFWNVYAFAWHDGTCYAFQRPSDGFSSHRRQHAATNCQQLTGWLTLLKNRKSFMAFGCATAGVKKVHNVLFLCRRSQAIVWHCWSGVIRLRDSTLCAF